MNFIKAKNNILLEIGEYRLKAIEEFYNKYKKYIEIIYIGGSRALYSYIDNPHDIDIVIALKDGVIIKNIPSDFIKAKHKLVMLNTYNDIPLIHCCYICSHDDKIFNKDSNIFLYYARYQWDLIVLFGEVYINKQQLSFLNHKLESLYKLQHHLKNMWRKYSYLHKPIKLLYYIAINTFIIENDSYILTAEQLITINKIHDLKSTDTDLFELEYNKLTELLNNLIIKYNK